MHVSSYLHMTLTRTHNMSLLPRGRNYHWCSHFKKRTPIKVCVAGQDQGSIPTRKNLAVHVSLSSFFTLSNTRPDPPRGSKASTLEIAFYTISNKTAKQRRKTDSHSAIFKKSPTVGAATIARLVSAGGLYERQNHLSTPKLTLRKIKLNVKFQPVSGVQVGNPSTCMPRERL